MCLWCSIPNRLGYLTAHQMHLKVLETWAEFAAMIYFPVLPCFSWWFSTIPLGFDPWAKTASRTKKKKTKTQLEYSTQIAHNICDIKIWFMCITAVPVYCRFWPYLNYLTAKVSKNKYPLPPLFSWMGIPFLSQKQPIFHVNFTPNLRRGAR